MLVGYWLCFLFRISSMSVLRFIYLEGDQLNHKHLSSFVHSSHSSPFLRDLRLSVVVVFLRVHSKTSSLTIRLARLLHLNFSHLTWFIFWRRYVNWVIIRVLLSLLHQRFSSQERDFSLKKVSCLPPINHKREDSQLASSRSSSALTRRWTSASVGESKCKFALS